MSVERVTSVLLGVGGLESLLMYYSLKEVREVEGKGRQRRKPALPPREHARVFVCNLDQVVAEAFCSQTKYFNRRQGTSRCTAPEFPQELKLVGF